MAVVTLRTRGAAAPDIAWERYAVPSRWPSWAPQLQRVEVQGGDRIAPGLAGTVHAGLLPWPTLPVRFVVEEVDEAARTWSWRVRLGPVRLRLEHGVTSSPAAGCATWLRVQGPRAVVAAYAPLALLALRRLVAP